MFLLSILGLLGIGLVADALSGEDDEQAASSENTNEETDGPDLIDGSEGDDSIFARGGADLVLANDGDDRVFGDEGDDLIFGESGNDFIRGGDDNDILFGGEGNDTLIGDQGNDIIFGIDDLDEDNFLGAVRDALAGEIDLATLEDELFNPDNQQFDLELGEADTLIGGSGDDIFFVGGNDVITTGIGGDVVSTGVWMDAGDSAIVTDFETGVDVLAYNYDETGPVPTVGFSENADNDAQLLIDDEVALVLSNVDFRTLSVDDVRLFAIRV